MSTALSIGGVWLALAVALALVVGASIRHADRTDQPRRGRS